MAVYPPQRNISVLILLSITSLSLLGLTGCAGNSVSDTPPPVPGEVQVVDSVPMPDTRSGEQAEVDSKVSGGGNQDTSVAIEQQFLLAANQAQQQQNWSGAIEQAERGLRVNRRQPELYLILAQSYWQLGKQSLASQFARQGLRYLGRGSEVLQVKLEQLAYPN